MSSDPSAHWIGTNSSAGQSSGNTALYAVSFQIPNGFTSGTLGLYYAEDDAISDTVIDNGPNTGVYLNGTAACGSVFAIGSSPQHFVNCGDVSSLLHVGTNWLYIEDANVAGPAGLIFSATITTTPTTVPTPTAGSPISFPNFSSTTGLSLVGIATNPSDTIQLTPASLNTAGAMWYTTPVNVQGGFSTTFSYTISPGGSNQSDGLSFVIQDDPSGPSAGGNNGDGGAPVGTFGISNSVAVALRTYTTNRIEIDSCGAGNAQTIGGTCVISFAPATLGGTHSVQINYSGGTLGVALDGTQVLSNAINLASAINLTSGGTAFVGITAGTGDGAEVATINSWSFSSLNLPTNSQPSVASLAPSTAPAGSGPLTLTITGTGFESTSSVTFNGVAHPASFTSSGQLSIALTAADMAAPGSFPVVVTNPSPGGGISQPSFFIVPPLVTAVLASPLTLSFTVPAGSNPPPQTFQVSGSTAGLAFTAQPSSTGNWLSVSQTSGPTPATINVSVNSAGLAVGTFPGTILVAGTGGAAGQATVNVTLTVTALLPTISKVTNDASYATGPIVPGEIIAIFGTDIGPATGVSQTPGQNDGQLTTSLGGVKVVFLNDGVAAPILYVSGSQVNAVVPYEVAGIANPEIEITYQGKSSNVVSLNSTSTAPGIFTLDSSGSGAGAILDSSYNIVGPTNPVTIGGVIQIYCIGLGAVTNQPATGTAASSSPLSQTSATPTVTISGVTAPVLFSGLAPGNVGLYQIDAQVPAGIVAGVAPLIVSIGGAVSNTVTVAIQLPKPQPSITSLSPSSATIGSNPLVLTINGSGFISSSTVTFNGAPHPPSLLGSGQLTITLSASDLATVGTFPVMVNNPSPGGGGSQSMNFIVSTAPNPQPSITSLSPSSATAGSNPLVLTINGSGFVAGSTVAFNGVTHNTSFINSAQLTIVLSAADLATAGSLSVVVSNPPPGGGSSNPINLSVSPVSAPVPPEPTGLSPGSTVPPGVTVNSLTPTLSWNASPGATGYQVVMVNSSIVAAVLNQLTTTTSITSPTLVNGATYAWAVEAINASGGHSTYTTMYFTVAPVQAALTGSWTGAWGSIPTGVVGTMSATLAQTGTALKGSIVLNSVCFPGGPLSGTITGSTISATITISGIELASLSGTVQTDGNTIDGTYFVTSGACFDDYGIFTLKR